MRQAIGAFLVLAGAALAGSDMIWVPAGLIGCGAVMALKKKAPSSRQAKEGALKKLHKYYITKGEDCKV